MSQQFEGSPVSSRPDVNRDQAEASVARAGRTTEPSGTPTQSVPRPSRTPGETAYDGIGNHGAPTALASTPQEPAVGAGPPGATGGGSAPTATAVAHGSGVRAATAGGGESVPRRSKGSPGTLSYSYRLRELVWLAAVGVDAFLTLDFLFRAIAAPSDGFVLIVLRVGNALASPFSGLFRGTSAAIGRTSFWSALIAVVIYSLAAWVVTRLITLVAGPGKRRAT